MCILTRWAVYSVPPLCALIRCCAGSRTWLIYLEFHSAPDSAFDLLSDHAQPRAGAAASFSSVSSGRAGGGGSRKGAGPCEQGDSFNAGAPPLGPTRPTAESNLPLCRRKKEN